MRTTFNDYITKFIAGLGVLALITVMQGQAKAMSGKILCQTSYGEKSMLISQNQVAWKREASGRSISSLEEARTEKKFLGYKKIMFINGHKHTIVIKNTSKFDESQDYLAITSPKGHEMTYPLNCIKTI